MQHIDSLVTEASSLSASSDFKAKANPDGTLYDEAMADRLSFWEARAKHLKWQSTWRSVLSWDRPYAKWFDGGTLNACENCLDIHLDSPTAIKPAIIWESEAGDSRVLTYAELHKEVCDFAGVLKYELGVKKGDRVTLYMPMIPELTIAVLACARIGAIHSVVFGGFSARSLKDRLIDSGSSVLITADGGFRRGCVVPLKSIADEALSGNDTPVKSVLVCKNTDSSDLNWVSDRDFDYGELRKTAEAFRDVEVMESEDSLFILYTSGTTGKPKGIVHSTGGYLTHAKYSTKTVFDLKEEDVYWCTADIGWITGHTYMVYGPLSNGATTVMFEGTPDFPTKGRFWDLIEKHKVTILYTAPTAIRAFMKWGEALPQSYDLSSLRLLGTVGEPINPEAWMWYHEHIGGQNCPIVDTWWQTETGGIMISNLPGHNDMKPGYAGLPLPGISAAVLDDQGKAVSSGGGLLSLTEPWPSMLRGVWGDSERFKSVYWDQFETYFAGDSATVDSEGYFKVLGRVDDVLNVSGHRIGTMEVESVLVDYSGVAEAAVVGAHDEIKGQCIMAFVTLKEGVTESDELAASLISFVASEIGAIAKPKHIVFTPDLPKTRSGKIMRRILKNLAVYKEVGDTTTLSNPDIVESIRLTLESKRLEYSA